MKDLMDDKFNRELKKKFRNAEFTPSSNVWEGIESTILKAENAKMKKKAAFYRNVAAAVILLAFISLYFNFSDQIIPFQDDFSMAVNVNENNTFQNNSTIFNGVDVATAGSINNSGLTSSQENNLDYKQKNKVIQETEGNNFDSNESNTANLDNSINVRNSIFISKLDNKKANEPYVVDYPNQSSELEKVSYFSMDDYKPKKENNNLNLIADLNFGSGSFNPNASTSGPQSLPSARFSNASGFASRDSKESTNDAAFINQISSAPMRSNLSLTYGVNIGLNLTNRIQLKSGVQYGKYRSTSESSAVIRDINTNDLYPYHAASSTAAADGDKIISVTSPYNLYNDFEILSIPLFFTYKIINQRLSVAILTGATADFMLSNSITGASDQLTSVSYNQSSNPAYKNVFASGVVGLEMNYQLGKHYGISLTPQYKKSISDITSSGTSFKSSPAFASVNMSFQYMF